MISKQLLEMLICPENGMSLRSADAELLRQVNDAIRAGRISNRLGDRVEKVLSEGLVREDGQGLYAVRDGIPVMLVDEMIPLDQVPEASEE